MPITYSDDGLMRRGTERNAVMGTPSDNLTIDGAGDVLFSGGGGLAFGEISVKDNAAATTLNGTTKVQVTDFDTNGPSNNTTPAHATDDITIIKAGMYMIVVSVTVINGAAQEVALDVSVWTNNGGTELLNLHADRTLTGGSGDVGSMSLSGIADLAVDDTVELWAAITVTANRDVIFQDVTLTLVQIGGT